MATEFMITSDAVRLTDAPDADAVPISEISAEAPLINPDGLHSRPAAAIVQALAKVEAKVTITDVTTGKGPWQ
jgi:hypothetical protein